MVIKHKEQLVNTIDEPFGCNLFKKKLLNSCNYPRHIVFLCNKFLSLIILNR